MGRSSVGGIPISNMFFLMNLSTSSSLAQGAINIASLLIILGGNGEWGKKEGNGLCGHTERVYNYLTLLLLCDSISDSLALGLWVSLSGPS